MKTLFFVLVTAICIQAQAQTANEIRRDFLNKLCVEKDFRGAANIVSAQFIRSMDGRVSEAEQIEAQNLGSELRVMLRNQAGLGSSMNVCP
jgi:hypothetical protein